MNIMAMMREINMMNHRLGLLLGTARRIEIQYVIKSEQAITVRKVK